ncbi:MAG: leucine-rich repeat domain-containing protein [Clostridia bacterium]|nr:leucine-rich repeat domain-containing protein [Clostridia bacterium]
MKKRLLFTLILVLCILLSFTLTACSGNDDDENDNDEKEDSEQSADSGKTDSSTNNSEDDKKPSGDSGNGGSEGGNSSAEETKLYFSLSEDKTYQILTGISQFNAETVLYVPGEYENLPVKEIGSFAFAYKNGYNSGNLTSVVIPEGVTTIASDAFKDNTAFTSITLPESLKTVGDRAFSGCANLKDITIPSGVEEIGAYAFWNCQNLMSITIPSSVVSMGDCAFTGVYAMTIYCEAQDEPNGWDSGWKEASVPVVWNCENNDVASDGYIYVELDGARYGILDGKATVMRQSSKITEFAIFESIIYKDEEYSVVGIAENAFQFCEKLEEIEIPSYITSVGSGAFSDCASLKTVKFGEGSRLTEIDTHLFAYCEGLTDINLPKGITQIGNYAFYGCTSLKDIKLPNGLTTINSSAFNGCTYLTNVEMPSTVASIASSVFENCESLSYNEYENGLYLGNQENPYAVLIKAKDKGISSCTINEGTRVIYEYAFSGCKNMTSVTVPLSVVSICRYAFDACSCVTLYAEASDEKSSGWYGEWNPYDYPVVWNCKNNDVAANGSIYTVIDGIRYSICDGRAIVEVQPASVEAANVPEYITYKGTSYPVKEIANYAFNCCDKLTSVTVPSGVEAIGVYAFQSCTALTSIVIPSSVTNIYSYAFLGCDSLTIYCEAKEQPSAWDRDWNNSKCPVVFGYTAEN